MLSRISFVQAEGKGASKLLQRIYFSRDTLEGRVGCVCLGATGESISHSTLHSNLLSRNSFVQAEGEGASKTQAEMLGVPVEGPLQSTHSGSETLRGGVGRVCQGATGKSISNSMLCSNMFV